MRLVLLIACRLSFRPAAQALQLPSQQLAGQGAAIRCQSQDTPSREIAFVVLVRVELAGARRRSICARLPGDPVSACASPPQSFESARCAWFWSNRGHTIRSGRQSARSPGRWAARRRRSGSGCGKPSETLAAGDHDQHPVVDPDAVTDSTARYAPGGHQTVNRGPRKTELSGHLPDAEHRGSVPPNLVPGGPRPAARMQQTRGELL